jgi:flagellar biosynthetic protein FliQ
MTPQTAMDLAYQAIITAAKLVAPLMITTLVIGIVMNIIQTVTSIKDMSLIFIPKLVGCMIVLSLSAPWMIHTITTFFHEMYGMFGAFTYS